jgi:2,4-dienoyl-CoA reductase-like NADH-dependent reductase (Old Yellow Enzyme family)
MKNRLMLAPLTNQQSHADGRLSDEELRWLAMRATGGFGMVMTAAAHVQAMGQGFAGQLGIFGDQHIDGLSRMAAAIAEGGALSSVQLHHAGMRAAKPIVAVPVGPSEDAGTGTRALALDEVRVLRDDFIAAARRAETAGFDGVEVHGAHGYVLAAFLSPTINARTDYYGGSAENRARLLREIIDGIRSACRADFQIGLRLSPERFGQDLAEIADLSARFLREDQIDYLDLSLWDVNKEPADERYQGRTLMSYFTELPRGNVRLGAAGNVLDAQAAHAVIEAGCDYVSIGRAAILRHDFPERVRRDPAYQSPSLPVSAQSLVAEGVSPPFMDYLRGRTGFVAEDNA